MNVRIIKPPRGGSVRAIASKSEAHRMLLCAALADGETFITCHERSEDIDATVRCLESMGAVLKVDQDGYLVSPIVRGDDAARERNLCCGESGSTLRFLLPVCGALGLNASFHMGGRLPERPLDALHGEMALNGCTLSEMGRSPLHCKGQLQSGAYTLPGNISSQFISGFLFALPLLKGASVLRVTGDLESRPYVDITLETLRLFGVSVFEQWSEGRGKRQEGIGESCVFHIPGGQVFRAPVDVCAGGDWSNAAFWLALGAIGESGVTCTGLDMDSRQGDRAVVELLMRFGAKVTCEGDTVTVLPGPLRGIDIDAGDTPDLVPILAVIACAAEGKTTIRNAGRLRMKESDRLSTVAESLSDLGADISQTETGLLINGKKPLIGGRTRSFGDHRIAMAAAILSAVCSGAVEISGAEAVNKSYPGFFDDFRSAMGGRIDD